MRLITSYGVLVCRGIVSVQNLPKITGLNNGEVICTDIFLLCITKQTPWHRTLLDKQTVAYLVKKYTTSYGTTWPFIAMSTTGCHRYLSCVMNPVYIFRRSSIKAHLIITFQSTNSYFEFVFSSQDSQPKFCTHLSPSYMPHPSHPS